MMDVHGSPTISSFVIRFIFEAASPDAPESMDTHRVGASKINASASFRGSIRHIQTEEELNFNTWEDAVAFIRRFVPLDKVESEPKDPANL